MQTAIIIHGFPSKEEYFDPTFPAESNSTWIPWVQRQLIVNGILAQTPEMPEPYAPSYEKYCMLFERFAIDADTILVGYSGGAGFLVRWLSEHKVKVGKVVLAAPFLDPDHDEVPCDFFKFTMDESLVERTDGVSIVYSDDDDQEILTSVEQIRSGIKKVHVKELTGLGHLTFRQMKRVEFPEMMAIILP
jgi:predicted alpha/beta hydrolase family esterase